YGSPSETSQIFLLLSQRSRLYVPVENQNDAAKNRSSTGDIGVDGPQNSRCVRFGAWLRNRPPDRADQRRSVGGESRHSLSSAVEAGTGRRHRFGVGDVRE